MQNKGSNVVMAAKTTTTPFSSSFAPVTDRNDTLAGESEQGAQTSPGKELTVLVSNFRGLQQGAGLCSRESRDVCNTNPGNSLTCTYGL